MPESGLVTVFCPSSTTAPETVLQAAERRLVVDCNVNPAELVGHDRTTLSPTGMIVRCGGLSDPKDRLKTVPLPEFPP